MANKGGNPAWVKGKSANPRGRPRGGNSIKAFNRDPNWFWIRHLRWERFCWGLMEPPYTGATAILNLINALEVYCVQVISYQEPWTETPGEIGELLYAIAGWVAKMECKRRSERTKAGLDRAIRQGKKLGRPKGSKDKKKRRTRTARIYA